MSLPKIVAERLTDIEHEVIALPEEMDVHQAAKFLGEQKKTLIRIVAFSDGSRQIAAVLPYTSLLDIKQFSLETEGDYTVLSKDKVASLFSHQQGSSFPPVSGCCEARLLFDKSIFELPEVIFESGNPEELIKINSENAAKLFDEYETLEFAASSERLYSGRGVNTEQESLDISFTPTRLKQRVDETFDLPAMPEIAQDIMKLRVDPSADATKLAQIVRRDPSLAAQVVSWASSPYYGYQGKIDSVETAIARVLGFELVMNLALGISIGKSLKVPMEGPLGVKEFWKQAIYSASLAEKLCRAMPIKQRPERGLIYLSGLLHNFGHLLLGHIFPPQFGLVNTTIMANPHIPVEDIEFYILGVTHQEIGAWLMQNWHMPDELIVAVHRHHQEEFWSKHAVYSNLVLVANRLLKRINIGDSVETRIPESTLELLSIDEEVTESALKDIELESETLDIMANQLVA